MECDGKEEWETLLWTTHHRWIHEGGEEKC